jgi:prefoldin subunit 5
LAKLAAENDKIGQNVDKLSNRIETTTENVDKLSDRIETTTQNVDKLTFDVDKVSENVDGLNKSQGKLMEEMFTAHVWEKFAEYGYEFTKGSRTRFKENKQVIAEVDIFLENGDYVMAIEVKNILSNAWVDDHLERLATVRDYMDRHNDKRKLVGGVAGGYVPENVKRYAENNGLYVMVQNGENVSISEDAKTFKEKVW